MDGLGAAVRKIADQTGFVVLPRRWTEPARGSGKRGLSERMAEGGERFFAWINGNRRLAKDVETTIKSARAFLYAASIILLIRRLARAA